MNTIQFKDEKFNRFINKSILIAVMTDSSEERENALSHYIEFIEDLYFYDMICEDDYLSSKAVLKRLQTNLK